jgi:recombination protein RecR
MYAAPVQQLIDELGRLPGIGPKSAQRIAFYILKSPAEDAARLASSITAAKAKVTWCRRCFNIAEVPSAETGGSGDGAECEICRDPRRDSSVLCVVEEPRDVIAFEKTGLYRGRYHVLLGALSPLDGIGPAQLKIGELLARIEAEGVTEVILSMNPNTEGEVTALHLINLLKDRSVKLTKIATGVPVGGDLEYADELTLGRALEGRHEVR